MDSDKIVRDSIKRLRDKDASLLVDPRFIAALAEVEDTAPDVFVEAMRAAAGMKLALRKELRKQQLRVVREDVDESPPVKAVLKHLNVPAPFEAELVMPSAWNFTPAGLIRRVERGQRVVTPSLLLPVQRQRDHVTGGEMIVVAYWDRKRWNHLTLGRENLVDARRIVSATAQYGFPVGSDNAAQVSRFLFDFLQLNSDLLEITEVHTSLGWVPGTTNFVRDMGGEVQFHGTDAGSKQIASSVYASGELQKWMEAAETVRTYPHVMLALYASLAAPLLRVIGADNVGIDFHAPTSTGKTTALMLAASVWGNPSLSSPRSFVSSWDATQVSVERRCAITKDLPIILDDSKRAKPDHISNILYMTHQGRGRSRGTRQGSAGTGSWRTVLISSGEAAAVSYSNNAGVRSRVISVPGLPFGSDDSGTRDVVIGLNRTLHRNFGHLGPLWIEWLTANSDNWDAFTRLYQDAIDDFPTSSGAGYRLAEAAAVISIAGQLAHEAIDFPWTYQDPFDTIWPVIVSSVADIHAHVRALRYIYDWAVCNEQCFYGRNTTRPPRGWYGRWDEDEEYEYLGIIPKVLRNELAAAGFDPQAVINEWDRNEWTIHAPDGRTTVATRIAGTTVRLVTIKRDAIETVAINETSGAC